MLIDKEGVLSFLPHREPFLFVDSIKRIDLPEEIKGKEELTTKDLVGVKVVGNFEVKDDLKVLEGHFPGNPILPGVIQVEMMAQVSAFICTVLNNLSIKGMNVETLLLGVDRSRFRKPITPGMELEVHSAVAKVRGQVASYTCEIFCDGEKISDASFIAKLVIKKEE